MIKVERLSCGYGNKEVLKNFNFHLKRGEFAGILGPNGSGKSTLLLAISGLLPTRSGSVRINGEIVSDVAMRERAKRMALVPQRSEFPSSQKCLSVVLMGRDPFLPRCGGYAPSDMNRALDAMLWTETTHLSQRMITEVSGGEAQRVMIAKALVQEAEILLLDEPTSSLDAARKIQMFDILRRKNIAGATILCAMGDLNLASLYCRRLIFVKHGRIVLDGSIEETFDDRKLSEVYETNIRISLHPITGRPLAHFVPDPYHDPDFFEHDYKGTPEFQSVYG